MSGIGDIVGSSVFSYRVYEEARVVLCAHILIYIYTYLIYICIYKYQICMGCGKQDGGMLTALLRCYTEFYENKLSTYFRLTPLL